MWPQQLRRRKIARHNRINLKVRNLQLRFSFSYKENMTSAAHLFTVLECMKSANWMVSYRLPAAIFFFFFLSHTITISNKFGTQNISALLKRLRCATQPSWCLSPIAVRQYTLQSEAAYYPILSCSEFAFRVRQQCVGDCLWVDSKNTLFIRVQSTYR